ncbi:hypothetical protein [Exiguobacterium sp. 17-1]|uniref:hypothetical protein n=1 Tax=Exiguobacterium sp. 17-1 TaxID=2931981 RepID=UPI001FFFFE71|nr:hypothetical protein [Exiguobacterium sp. 17-1]MCK2157581.1 hypothetical protein [Exiguobacterium sp. 17-1]
MSKRLNEPRMTSGGKWTLVSIFVVLLIGTILGNMSSQSKVSDEPKKEVKATDEKKIEKEPDLKSTDLKNSTPDTIEKDLKLYDKDIDKVTVKDKTLIVTYRDSAFWSDNSLLEEYAYNSINLIEDLYPNQNFDLFAFERPTVMTDDSGNEKLDTVFKSFYTRSTLDQINLDNFTNMVLVDRERYFQKADGYWLHPGIFLNVDKKLRESIRSPINFDNMDESRYTMRDGATNDLVEQPDSVKKEEPIVAEPVTEDAVEEPQTEAEQSISYDAPAIVNSTFIITQGFDQLSFKIKELSGMVGTKGDLVTAPLSSSLFSLKEMMDHTGQEITKLQQTSTPSDISATTEQLATNQAEMNRIYEELQQQFYSIDKQDYPDAVQLASAIKQNFSVMEKLTHPDVSAYSTFFKENADEEGS